MIKHKLIKKFLAVLILSSSLIYFGCEKKAEDSRQTQQKVTSETISPDTASSVATESEPVTENKIQIPDIKGTWTGKFDKRATTLTITEQTDSSFSGKISISYREAINQEVKGNFSPTTLKMTMTDQLHSRYMGKYSGNLSKDGKIFSGIFIMNHDGSKISFNLIKK